MTARPPVRPQDYLLAVGLAAVTAVIFLSAVQCNFVSWDDPDYVPGNPHVLGGLTADNVRWALTRSHAGYWLPTTWLSLQLDSTLFGTGPAGYHATNVALHAVNAGVLYLVLTVLTGSSGRSAAVALLWAVHPLRVESVAWVTERKDVLSGLFALVAVGAYARYTAAPSAGRMLAVAGLLAAGLAAKPMLVTLPCGLLLLDLWPLGRLRSAADLWPRVREKWLLFVLAVGWGGATLVTQSGAGAVKPLGDLTAADRASTALVGYGAYLRLTAYPYGLCAHYPLRAARPPWQPAVAALALVGVSAVVWWLRRRAPYLLVGWLWFVGTLLPVSGLVQSGTQAYADRFTYLPHVGLLVAVVWAAADLAGRLRVPVWGRTAAVAATAVGFGFIDRHQIAVWENGTSLWERVVAVAPDGNAVAFNNLGGEYKMAGRLDDAVRMCEEAVRIDPSYLPARFNLVGALHQAGRRTDAERAAREALAAAAAAPRRTVPADVDPVQTSFCWTLAADGDLARGRPAEAAHGYAVALRHHPLPQARLGLGMALVRLGRPADALPLLAAARDEHPHEPELNYQLGVAYSDLGDWANAVPRLDDAARLRPDSAAYRAALALALEYAGRPAEAADQARAAARLDPNWLAGWTQVVWRLAAGPTPNPAAATRAAALAVAATDPPTPQALDAAAAAAAAGGRFPEAVALAERAAAAADRPDLAAAIRGRIDLYRAGRPYREPPPAP